MKVESLAKFREYAEALFRANQNTRYFMKYRDDDLVITLKVTDNVKTYTYDIKDRKEMNAVTELNMKMMSYMSGRTKLE
ncbi:hypothetical protein ENUP19_0317G0082 [Entamoeba nuttalli]|uniref:Signal recognition particle 9 kDa protein n=2 Tax=Entamoeba nuttalli TaxID=412467 RepID=K2H5H8_ENTNP|nr:hypothetical protein ENU1_188600 [Entamoeba nuttalli P19]EKE37709.1 hypothetical protein ENU1_188600 [Entamoeba nuttalli P19]|eukprot:XP_008859955.1 hypothetical protein ENU1_188600 [Entamoeba nuttalli P19]